ncbi:MAG TPA: hypothetical protein PLT86_07825 [Candidatus Latescibacteria bacterium]|nr:hypothetical protein [Candidatus Latescibacterota bacterium]
MRPPWTSSTPFTYEIGYGQDYVGNEQFLSDVRRGRPTLLHCGHDVPLNSATGNTIQFTPRDMKYLDPEGIPARMSELRQYVDSLHEAGVKWAVPYLITMLIIGDPEKRTGFWNLYDRWEEYSALGIGEKPGPPESWFSREPRPFPGHPGMLACETTISHPEVRRFLHACTDLVARCGYDGVFLDVNTLIGRTPHDDRWFGEYLSTRYSESELKRRFGFASLGDVRLGEEGAGLLWVETQRFRAWAFGQLFAALRDAGREHVPGFFVLPNNSPMCTIEGFFSRRGVGHGMRYIRNGCDLLMFEEMQQAGRFGADRIVDNILQYKMAAAHGMRGVVLLYNATDRAAINLANAEAAAGGGGAFVQCGFAEADTMRFWREWFERHSSVLEGMDSLHTVGVLHSLDEMYWDNRAHLEALYRLRQSLSDHHVLFDILLPEHLEQGKTSSFRILVLPEVRHLSNDQVAGMARFCRNGGKVILLGECGTFDETGARRDEKLCDVLDVSATSQVRSISDIVPTWGPELYELSEEDYNDFDLVARLPDRVASASEAEQVRRSALVPLLDTLLGEPCTFLQDAPYSLRVSAFRSPDGRRTVVHLVNYDLPVLGKGMSGNPIPAGPARIRYGGQRAHWFTPEGVEGDAKRGGDGSFVIPAVETYCMVVIE